MNANLASQVMESLRTTSTQSTKQASLKPGQMVTGKVLKLFPGQKALIQIGTKQMSAQLQAALNLHGQYMFQVESAEDLVHLKVLGDSPAGQGDRSVSSLLSQLGMTYQKDRASLVQQLIKQNIPFSQSDLKQAFPLLEKYNASPETKNVLLEMMNKKLPLKESIFLALRERMGNSPTLTSSLQSLNGLEASNTEGSQSISKSTLSQSNQSFSQQLTSLMGRSSEVQNQTTYSLLQKAQLIPNNKNQVNWSEQVKSWLNSTDVKGSATHLQNAPLSQTNEEAIARRLVELFQKQLPIAKGNQQQLRTFSQNLAHIIEGTHTSSQKQSQALHQVRQTSTMFQQEGMLNKLSSQLEQQGVTKEVLRNFFSQLQNVQSVDQAKQTLGRLQQVFQAVQDVTNSQLTKHESRTLMPLLSSVQQEHSAMLPTGKDYFLTQLKSVMQQSGLNYEHQMINQQDGVELAKSEHTLKGSILQSLHDSLPSQVSDKLSSILNHLNGMVLSVQDSDQTLQMNLQLPGNWFGIEQDLIMDLEGRKNEQDEIDPDYCHILFYLQLQSLDETVIDMRIQKRIVQLSLYTDNDQAENLIKSFKPMLEEGLEKLDYKLSTVRHRSLETEAKSSDMAAKQRYSSPYSQGGVDFRI
ncbi:Vir family protein [Pontibacillus marinus]|uniref:Flagellar hook-length control protein-like C-terminal domain-containing protein n=1 Tax=Pontibacillus marinus BH030004 = DSM 16465 TaxID=1385511 RepID=A0A0A5FSD7_9BACI|nr:hypothetical protein [Pontibacillus marinus]KGX83691.1 hypothetical protein N783_01705 [Pontibacillus marinus BH030004 = DSM 16465]